MNAIKDALAAMSESEFQLYRNWSAANFIFFTSTIVDEDIATAYILINSESNSVLKCELSKLIKHRMSDAGDDNQVDVPAEVEVAETTEAPKGKLSVEDALKVRHFFSLQYFN